MNKENTPFRLVFMGPLYPENEEKSILDASSGSISSAPNVFQWNLIHGIEETLSHPIEIINCLPVGTWSRNFHRFFLKNRQWKNGEAVCHEVGCVNLPFIKQAMRASKAKRLLKKLLRPGDHLVLYSAYMPFLKAIHTLPKDVDVTVIITDLPEFYDLGQTSRLRKTLRNMQNRLVYRCLSRADRFVLLTEQMKEPMQVGHRPWLLMEGICAAHPEASPAALSTSPAFLYSGTLHYRFGIKNLLEAFQNLDATDAELWICGAGEAEAEIKSLAEKDSRIKFFGFLTQSDVANLRSKAAVLVNPRPNEGEYTKYSFPSKTMEYMASGKPVIMYPLEGVPGEYAPYLYFADGKGWEGLLAQMNHVLAHPQEARLKGEAARDFVTRNKCRKAQGQRLVAFLKGE